MYRILAIAAVILLIGYDMGARIQSTAFERQRECIDRVNSNLIFFEQVAHPNGSLYNELQMKVADCKHKYPA